MELNEMIDQKEIDEALVSDPDVIEDKVKLAEAARDYWKSIVPVDTGADRDAIHVVRDGHNVLVVNDDDPVNIYLEYGTVNMHEYACRARTEAYFKGRDGEI